MKTYLKPISQKYYTLSYMQCILIFAIVPGIQNFLCDKAQLWGLLQQHVLCCAQNRMPIHAILQISLQTYADAGKERKTVQGLFIT